MGGGASKEVTTASPSTPGWNPQREEWWTSVSSSYENITSIGDALTSCYTLMEASWSTRSENYKFLSETKLRHVLSSCKTFLNLSIAKELQQDKNEAQYWFHVNLATSALSTILFIVITFMVARLRRSTRLRQRMKQYMPTSWFEKKSVATAWYKKTPTLRKQKSPFPPQHLQPPVHIVPDYPQQDPYHQPIANHTQQGSSMPGAPGGQYPVAASRNSHSVNNFHSDKHLPITGTQNEDMDHAEHVARIDQQIARLGSGGRGQGRDSQTE